METLAGYGVIKHGEAVSIGMVMAARISHRLDLCSIAQVNRIKELLTYFELPVTPPDFSVADYLAVMQRDKKVKDGMVRVVLNHGIGSADLHQVDGLDKLQETFALRYQVYCAERGFLPESARTRTWSWP